MTKRKFGKLAVGVAAGVMLSAGAAHGFPDKEIRLIVPYNPGGGTDTIARSFAAAMEDIAGQPVIVENIPGAGGTTGMLALRGADADGHTIAINGSVDVSGFAVFRDQIPYAFGDFACAGGVFNTPTWALAHKDQAYSGLDDFIEKARQNPGKLNVGVSSIGSPHHVMASAIAGANDIDINVVPFNGGGPLKKAILANQVDLGIIHAPVLLSDVKEGTIEVLAAGGSLQDISYEPVRDTPHIREWGADVDVGVVRGIWLPSATPPAVQTELEALVKATVESAAFTEFAINFGFAPYSQPGAEFCARLPQEVEDYKRIKDNFMQLN